MSVSLIIVLLLIIAYRAGARRGLVQTIVNVVGYVAVAFAAGYLAHEYGPYFAEKMPQIANEGNGFLAVAGINLNSSFYQIMLFWIFTIGLGIVFRMISGSIGIFAKIPVVSSVNRVLGGLASFLMMYAVIFFALLFAASWPNARVRNSIDDSTIARFILNKTPGLSEKIISDWLPIKDG